MKLHRIPAITLALSLGISAFPLSSLAEERVHTTSDTLLARIQVEDFINDYYWELANVETGDVADFWAEDAVFDVNGNIFDGIAAIREAYAGGLGPGGRLVFQPTIPRIHVEGNTATVDLVYTGVLNTDPTKAPVLYEQGHDHMELTRTDAGWFISRRSLRTFSLDESYEE